MSCELHPFNAWQAGPCISCVNAAKFKPSKAEKAKEASRYIGSNIQIMHEGGMHASHVKRSKRLAKKIDQAITMLEDGLAPQEVSTALGHCPSWCYDTAKRSCELREAMRMQRGQRDVV